MGEALRSGESQLSDEELAGIKAKLARQEEWALEHGYARKCPNCGDVVWEGGERCGCGRTKPPVIITDADLRRLGL